jgi:sugar-specific transcriptional regulator TrmB
MGLSFYQISHTMKFVLLPIETFYRQTKNDINHNNKYCQRQIKHKMDVDLPRPRKYQILTSNKFFDLKAEAIRVVMEEASGNS